MNREQKRAIIADQLEETPDHTDRRIAKMLGVHHATVASVREELQSVGTLSISTLKGCVRWSVTSEA